jgi:hypothetical protein
MTLRFYHNYSDGRLLGEAPQNCIIFAEGSSEALFLEEWLTQNYASRIDISVVCFEGQKRLKTIFRRVMEEKNFSNVTNLGFFLDAESMPASNQVESIKRILVENEVLSTVDTLTAGRKCEGESYNIAVFVSPDNNSAGCIEDIIKYEILSSPLSSIVEACEGINGLSGVSHVSFSKSLVQAYIGLVKPGLCGTGRAFTTGALDITHNAYDVIKTTFESIL